MMDELLSEAKTRWYTDIAHRGGQCPCCDRFGKYYTRHFNGNMARGVSWLAAEYLKGGGEWVDVPLLAPRWLVQSNQLATTRWWGLVERRPNDDPAKKHSGMWRPTPRGVAFVRQNIAIPKSVVTYKGEVIDRSDELIRLPECFKERFDYDAMMREDWAGPIREGR